MTDHPIVCTVFKKYIDTPYQEYIFPIIPARADVKLGPDSKVKKEQLGKIPGRYNAEEGHWTGLGAWPAHRATQTQLERYEIQQLDTGPTAAAMNCRIFRVIDIDTEDKAVADIAQAVADEVYGKTPVVRRRDGSERRVLFYRREDGTVPVTRGLALYRGPDGKEHLIERLGDGQLVVIEGPHAKSGKMQYFENGGLVDHIGELPLMDVTSADAYFARLDEVMAEKGYERVRGTKAMKGRDSELAPAISITDLMSPHLAKDMATLEKAVRAIDFDDERINYDRFINILRGICAACGGSVAFLHQVVWPHICESQKTARGQGPLTRDQGIEWLEARWSSFTDSQLGAEHIYGWAAAFGETDALMDVKRAKAEEILRNAPAQPDPWTAMTEKQREELYRAEMAAVEEVPFRLMTPTKPSSTFSFKPAATNGDTTSTPSDGSNSLARSGGPTTQSVMSSTHWWHRLLSKYSPR
jgi:hypothetical protein